jgi:Flp pilus assembly pilin Flp
VDTYNELKSILRLSEAGMKMDLWEAGQGLLEYSMAVVLVAVLILAIVAILGHGTNGLFGNVVYNF